MRFILKNLGKTSLFVPEGPMNSAPSVCSSVCLLVTPFFQICSLTFSKFLHEPRVKVAS